MHSLEQIAKQNETQVLKEYLIAFKANDAFTCFCIWNANRDMFGDVTRFFQIPWRNETDH